MSESVQPDSEEVKSCCATLYASDWARLLLGDSFHPGGTDLTGRLGELLDLQIGDRVLDVAAGRGTSAIYLAKRFGCEVVGIDYSPDSVSQATAEAKEEGLAGLVRFEQGDAEHLPFGDGSFDAILCECAFCIFPDKPQAAAEFARVLRPGGRVGLSDLTRSGSLPEEIATLFAWIACVGDARPVGEYVDLLSQAGFAKASVEAHDDALRAIVHNVRGNLIAAELIAKLGKLTLPIGDIEQAKRLAKAAATAVSEGRLGYALIVAKLA